MRAALAVVLLGFGCGEPTEPAAAPEIEVSAGNDPISVEIAGHTMRVRCEVSCGPSERELDALRSSCMRNATGTPGAVAIDGESLRGLGCCHEAERAYTSACGEESSRCTSGWLAGCERGALSTHASGSGVSLTPIDDRTPEEREAAEHTE
jgi:hypothetical protein